MYIEEDEIEALLLSPKKAGSHWICDCPSCGAKHHFYVRRRTQLVDKRGNNKSYNWDCKKCKEEGGLSSLLRLFGKIDLYDLKKPIGDVVEITFDVKGELSEHKFELPDKMAPLGFKRVDNDPYLNSRGFTDIDYYRYEVGYTRVLPLFRNYVIIMVYQKHKPKGYLARCVLDKKTIKENNLKRYLNSKHTDFGKMLFGIDEVVAGKTKEVSIVEGFFDKNSVDNALKLNDGYLTKCLCSFGNKISDEQIFLLKEKGVEDVILAYDIDALKEMKKYINKLKANFKNVHVTFTENKDFNDSKPSEIIYKFDSSSLIDASFFADNYVALPKFS